MNDDMGISWRKRRRNIDTVGLLMEEMLGFDSDHDCGSVERETRIAQLALTKVRRRRRS